MENKTVILIFLLMIINLIGHDKTNNKIKSYTHTLKFMIPFYWFYYIIKMNIKKQWKLYCLKQEIYDIDEYYYIIGNDRFWYNYKQIIKKTIKKINQL